MLMKLCKVRNSYKVKVAERCWIGEEVGGMGEVDEERINTFQKSSFKARIGRY